MTTLMTPEQFATSIKTKYPQYKDMDNTALTTAMLKKYPQYKSQIDMSTMNTKSVASKELADTKGDIKKIGTDFNEHEQNAKDIDSNPKLNIGGKILGNIANAAGGMSDLIGDTLNAAGIGDILRNMPTFDANTGKVSTLGKSISNEIDTIKKSATKIKAVQDMSTSVESFMKNHPNDTEGVKALINSFGAFLNASGISDIAGAETKEIASGSKDAVADTEIKPKENTVEERPPKTPGIRAALTPVKSDVKTSFKSLVNSFGGDTTKAKKWITDLFTQEKGRVSNVDIDSPNARLANNDLSEAKNTISSKISSAVESKSNTIKKFADTAVTGFKDAESGAETTTKDILDKFKDTTNKLMSSTVELSNSQMNVVQKFSTQLEQLVQKGTLKDFDEFVDRWQQNNLGGSGTNAQKIDAVINSTVHDVNEATKAAADTVDEGAYREANSTLNKLYKVKDTLEKGMGDKGAFTGKYAGAANYYSKAAGGDSAAREGLRDIEEATGIPLAQRANLAKFVETFGKKVPFSKVVTDLPKLLFTRMGKISVYNDLVSFLGDPEGAAIQELDKNSKGLFSKAVTELSSQIENDDDAMEKLNQSGFNSKQGAGLLILGQLQNKISKKSGQ